MDTGQNSQQGSVHNDWWLKVLDTALNEPSTAMAHHQLYSSWSFPSSPIRSTDHHNDGSQLNTFGQEWHPVLEADTSEYHAPPYTSPVSHYYTPPPNQQGMTTPDFTDGISNPYAVLQQHNMFLSPSQSQSPHEHPDDRPSSSFYFQRTGNQYAFALNGQQASDTTPNIPGQDQQFSDFTRSITSAEFLRYHSGFFKVTSGGEHSQVPVVVNEASPDASLLKDIINEQLFETKLQWDEKGDDLLRSSKSKNLLQRFVRRINVGGSRYTAQLRTSVSDRQIFVVQHPSYANGNFMFSPAPGTDKKLLFSVWALSQDDQLPRMQFVGSAALTADDATRVIRQADKLKGLPNEAASQLESEESSSQIRQVRPPRRNDVRLYHLNKAGLYTSSNDWLSHFPLVESIGLAMSQRPALGWIHFISQIHRDADRVKEAAARVLFGYKLTWQSPPEDAITPAGEKYLIDIIRSHKRSKYVYVTKAEVSRALPYEMALIPYQVRDSRSKLFDPALRGNSHTFTLWAYDGASSEENEAKFFLVSGVSISMEASKDILKEGAATFEQLENAAHHDSL